MNISEIMQKCDELSVKFIRLRITDINGMPKNVEFPVSQIEEVLKNGMMFDGSSIDGFVRIEESDMMLKPDLKTFAILPWTNDGERTARFICDVYDTQGNPFEGDPRYVLKKVVKEAKDMGVEALVGPEPEFFMFDRDDSEIQSELLDDGGYFDLLPVDKGERIRKNIVIALEKMGFEVEAAHHEVAPSQHEIDFRYTDILKTADNIQTFKWVVKTMALMENVYATFMPKVFSKINGSGMHLNISLSKDGKNAFGDESKKHGLSDLALYFIGGIIKHAKEITAFSNPTVNSYKRLLPGYEAPVNISWALGNRSAMIRVPSCRGSKTRIELRSPDPSCNPYLALTIALGAGLDGIKNKINPPEPIDMNIFHLNDSQKEKMSIENLPADLKESIKCIKESDFCKEIMGNHIFNTFISIKEKEWEEYTTSISKWEFKKYFRNY